MAKVNARYVVPKLREYGWNLRHDPNCTSGDFVCHIFRKGAVPGALSIAVLVVKDNNVRITWTEESYGHATYKFELRRSLIDDCLKILDVKMTIHELGIKLLMQKSRAYRHQPHFGAEY